MCCPIKTQNSILDFLLNNFKFETNHFQVPNTRFVLHKSSTSQAPPTSKAPPTSQALPTSQASSNSQTTLNSQSPNQIYVHDEKTLLTEISDLPENFLPKSCGEIDTPKIFGGNIAGIFEFSWMVFLYYQSGKYYSIYCFI